MDYGLGFCANPLELGCDCLGHIKYFDAVLNNSRGGVTVIKKAVCMHEEDVGMAWKVGDGGGDVGAGTAPGWAQGVPALRAL